MIIKLLALLIVAGACYAFPLEDQSTAEPPPGHINPDRYPVDSGRGPFVPEGPVNPPVPSFDPERGPSPEENEHVTTEVPDLHGGPKPDESDLKTDATFWWPSYRSSWSYPSYRTYWSYPTYYYSSDWSYPRYRYYRPRTYYSSNYYW